MRGCCGEGNRARAAVLNIVNPPSDSDSRWQSDGETVSCAIDGVVRGVEGAEGGDGAVGQGEGAGCCQGRARKTSIARVVGEAGLQRGGAALEGREAGGGAAELEAVEVGV